MRVNVHHRLALLLLGATITLDIGLGLTFGAVQHVGAWHGIYCATANATTVGCDVTPHGWLAYAISFAELLTLVPLVGSVLAFFTTGLTTAHFDQRHDELKEQLTVRGRGT